MRATIGVSNTGNFKCVINNPHAGTSLTKATKAAALRSLSRLHDLGVAHGDVRMDNLLLSGGRGESRSLTPSGGTGCSNSSFSGTSDGTGPSSDGEVEHAVMLVGFGQAVVGASLEEKEQDLIDLGRCASAGSPLGGNGADES